MTNHTTTTERIGNATATTIRPTPTVTLTAEQVERLSKLVDDAIFATTSWMISAVKGTGYPTPAADLATLIESDRMLKVALGRVEVKS